MKTKMTPEWNFKTREVKLLRVFNEQTFENGFFL